MSNINNKRNINQISPDHPPLAKRSAVLIKSMENMPGEVGKMTPQQLIELIGSVIDIKLNKVASIEYVNTINEKCITLEKEVDRLKSNEIAMLREINDLKNFNKRNNLIIYGIKKMENEDVLKSVKAICSDILELKNLNIERAFRIGRDKNTVLVKFNDFEETVDVLKNCKKLKNTNIFIQRDYTNTTNTDRKIFIKIKQEIKKINPELKVLVRTNFMYIGELNFSINNNIFCCNEKENGIEMLSKALNKNMSEYISNLFSKTVHVVDHSSISESKTDKNSEIRSVINIENESEIINNINNENTNK